MKETCYYQGVEVEFLGIFQYSRVIGESPLIGGPPGGTIAYPIAVIKKDGSLHEVSISNLKFEKDFGTSQPEYDSPMYGR